MDNPYSDIPHITRQPPPPLATEWDRMPRLFGRWRDTLSLAADDDCVVLMVESEGLALRWVCSPPAPEFEWGNFRDGRVTIADYADIGEATMAARSAALAAYAEWCSMEEAAAAEALDVVGGAE